MKSITIELQPVDLSTPGSFLKGELITQRWGWTLNAQPTNYRPCDATCSDPNNYLLDFDTSLHAGGSYALQLTVFEPFLCEETCDLSMPDPSYGRTNCKSVGCPAVCDENSDPMFEYTGLCFRYAEGFASDKINSRQFSAAHYVARDPGIVKTQVPEPSVSWLLICGVILLAVFKRGRVC